MSEPNNREAAVLNAALQLRSAERPARSLDKLQGALATAFNSFLSRSRRGFFGQGQYVSISAANARKADCRHLRTTKDFYVTSNRLKINDD